MFRRKNGKGKGREWGKGEGNSVPVEWGRTKRIEGRERR
jgi:hypothetical protein